MSNRLIIVEAAAGDYFYLQVGQHETKEGKV